MATVTIQAEEAKRLVIKQLTKVGLNEETAGKIAEVLVHADLRNVNSHGVLRTEHYVNRLQAGGINPEAQISFQKTGPVTGVVDGDDGFGHVISDVAMDHAIDMARENGVGMVTVFNSSHCGALSYFVQKAADAKLIGIAMSHTDKIVVPFGGKTSFLGTNPIAYGVPAKTKKPYILDMATSNVAWGKILQAREEGKEIPEGWGVDEHGAAVTDPNKVVSLSTFGGPKGYGLSVIVDVFSGLLAGAAFGPHIGKMYDDLDKKRKLGHYFCVINPSFFTDTDIFLEQMDQMIEELKQVEPAPGFDRVYVPGEIEQINEEKNLKHGITIASSVYEFLTK
ncbi:ureidoglycolate dehydrogenase [Peribacillus frigoritolerans]|uniref:ureidoglycolate dehydrogenase n=1 Tax=Peribacillus frigoritolerans TaxID=450367 RepID=UPI0007BF342A|nr:ureidoglycolate dehydrogenase [Peribacillus frigoritolerans]PAW27797.1 ureidoglycolate dehydrogenase [Peribacillus simplex]PEF39466.1 ureidoglycolate dehydrogenase [Bacillus sp. AFS094228]PEO48738.1 ureidoglycolate dehydrogenase [Bacillus sp. AFS026049]QNK47313.1 ureidoglycolate dehydrogenase [Brevibacterium sp. PAMC23299]MCR8868113.1 ureidoglycolate dehydrogenase [Peribacillus frigoritolerans]